MRRSTKTKNKTITQAFYFKNRQFSALYRSDITPWDRKELRLAFFDQMGVGIVATKDLEASTLLPFDCLESRVIANKMPKEFSETECVYVFKLLDERKNPVYVDTQDHWFGYVNHDEQNPSVACDEKGFIRLLRDISAGEQLTRDYGYDYWQSKRKPVEGATSQKEVAVQELGKPTQKRMEKLNKSLIAFEREAHQRRNQLFLKHKFPLAPPASSSASSAPTASGSSSSSVPTVSGSASSSSSSSSSAPTASGSASSSSSSSSSLAISSSSSSVSGLSLLAVAAETQEEKTSTKNEKKKKSRKRHAKIDIEKEDEAKEEVEAKEEPLDEEEKEATEEPLDEEKEKD